MTEAAIAKEVIKDRNFLRDSGKNSVKAAAGKYLDFERWNCILVLSLHFYIAKLAAAIYAKR
jgi:hypothetical protein